MSKKPTYEELKEKLKEAEQILDTLRNHKVDAVIGTDDIARMRLEEVEDELHEQIKVSSKRLQEIESIYRNVPVGLCVLDTDLKFVRLNDHLAEMNGVSAEEHIGKTVSELLPNLYKDIEHELREVIETGESKMDLELSSETPDQEGGERHWLEHWLPLYNEQDEVIGINMVVQEITERKQYEKKLEQLNESLEERVERRTESLISYQDQLRSLASQLSKAEEQERHRLATELHDNLGQMLALCKMKMDGLEKDRFSDDIASEIDDIQELVENALSYSREMMSDLKPPPTLEKEDVRATIEWLAEKMGKHDLNVIVNDDEQPKPTSKEIRTTLLQCVRELLFNVIKHSGVEEARVNMSRLDNWVQIIVEDKGKGFDTERSVTASAKDGGFGLFNVKERLDLLGCDIDIDSEPGKGTKVTLLAPIKDAEKPNKLPKIEKAERKISSGDSQIIKVMLVDDHQMVLDGLKKIVDAEDDLTVVAEASDGEEAVKLAREKSMDVIVMDVNMPFKDGIDATHEIKSEMPKIQVIGLSLHYDKEVIDSMRNAGATAYLSKSEAFETLCATIRSEAEMGKKIEP